MRQSISLISAALALQSVFAAELPVRKVILYKHGIGYFERGGEISAGQSARLDFKAAEMNDVLKSLTINDLTGNSVAGVRYDSSLPLAAKLAEFPFKLGDRSPLTDFLDQLKGAKVEMKFGQSTVNGQIVGARSAQGHDKPQTTTDTITVLTSAGDIQSFDLGTASSVKLSDPELQLQLSEYLRSLNASRSREQKSVYIDSARDAARKLSVAYTIPMPIWKSSYRLVLDAGAAKRPMLEGWAIIDNTTNEDWTRVDLSVISGRPISFISNLYAPKYLQRQIAELEEDKPLAPVMYNSAPMQAVGGILGGVAGGSGGFSPKTSAMTRNLQAIAEASTVQTDTATISGVLVNNNTREAGELFEYRFNQPVSVKRNESIMLPFVQQEIAARKLLIYSENSGRENPLNSAELTNSTGKTLDGGPMSVYDGGVYAGEALVNTFKAGDKRLLSYASDLGTRVVEDSNEAPRFLREVKVSDGAITQRFTSEVTKTYKISNVDKKQKTLMIEHAIRYDHKLATLKPTEQTATHYRFEVKLTGEPAQALTIKEERTILETNTLRNVSDDDLGVLISGNRLSAEAKQTLNGILALRRQVNQSNETIKTLGLQVTASTTDQERVRRNLQSLNSVAGQQERVQKYATDLANLDAKIVTLRDQIVAETKKRDDLNNQLSLRIDAAKF